MPSKMHITTFNSHTGLPSSCRSHVWCMQTDAPINGGSSGGALLDSGGRLVGISTATFGRKGSGRGSGVNFALPVDLVVDIVPKLIVYGNASGKGMG